MPYRVVIAYERKPLHGGSYRRVLFFGGRVEMVSDAQLRNLLLASYKALEESSQGDGAASGRSMEPYREFYTQP